MIALSLMPMNRTFMPGSYSSGMPTWCRPTTPWSSSPVRIAMMLDVLSSVIGILLHGNTGTPRQAGIVLPATSTVCGYRPRRLHSRPNALVLVRAAPDIAFVHELNLLRYYLAAVLVMLVRSAVEVEVLRVDGLGVDELVLLGGQVLDP